MKYKILFLSSAIFFFTIQVLAKTTDHFIFIGDTQQREIIGSSTGFSDKTSDNLSHVAIRSSDQEVFGKFIAPEILSLQKNNFAVFHLGDMLDYSCESEWLSAAGAIDDNQWEKLYVLPGNHDGLFQGNGGYGWVVRAGLKFLQKIFDKNYDPSLEGHFKNVCNATTKKLANFKNPEFRKRDFFCSYAMKRASFDSESNSPFIDACKFVEKARHNPVESSTLAIIDVKSPIYSQFENEKFGYGVAAVFSGISTGKWSPGYFVQAVSTTMLSQSLDTGQQPLTVIMVDTADWSAKPEFLGSCNSSDNTACGAISKNQRESISTFLKNLAGHTQVIFAGHYPLDKMEIGSRTWLEKTVSSVSPHLYISAHTHNGYLKKEKLKNFSELNLDSLIDWPASYWTAEYKTEPKRICLKAHDVWKELSCDSALSSSVDEITESANVYRAASKPWAWDYGESQWRWRALDATKAIASFMQFTKNPASCSLVNIESKRSHFEIAADVKSCISEVDAFIKNNPHIRKIAACRALVGAAAFAARKPGLPVNLDEKYFRTGGNSKYEEFCVDTLD